MELLTPDPGLIFWHATILGAALLILTKYAWKPILSAIKKREQAYQEAAQQIETAEKKQKQLHVTKEKI